MGKAILVIEMPESCKDCALSFNDDYSNWCVVPCDGNTTDIFSHVVNSTKPEWCPLKPAPEPQLIWYCDEGSDWERGYNDCLHEIVGEEE